MLVLSRKTGEKIAIGNDITVVVLESSGNRIRIGIEAPQAVAVHRAEVLQRQREFAATADEQLSPAMV